MKHKITIFSENYYTVSCGNPRYSEYKLQYEQHRHDTFVFNVQPPLYNRMFYYHQIKTNCYRTRSSLSKFKQVVIKLTYPVSLLFLERVTENTAVS